MELRIYNSRTRKKELFKPQREGEVTLYVCGVTVYDQSHIGHARSFIVFDTIVRYLEFAGYNVRYIRNFTDVDDKIIRKALEEGRSPEEIAERYIREFHEDMEALRVEKATYEPRATEYIPAIINMIKDLLRLGFAYAVNGNVYFSVEKFPGYGKLSGRNLEEMMAGARVEPDPTKLHPMDFALWKASKAGEPKWESPWGLGRPGWHIECSAMSTSLLGETLDIHGGGKDLIFPHHENELAQTEAVTGKPFVRYWIHNGFVTLKREKMSKSLGNFLTIREMLVRFHPEVIRMFLLSSHYRSPLDYTEGAIHKVEDGLTRMYTTLEHLSGYSRTAADADPPRELTGALDSFQEGFYSAMSDDFNTARAIGFLFDLIKKINRFLHELPETPIPPELKDRILQELKTAGELLGILKEDPKEFLEKIKTKRAEHYTVDVTVIQNLVDQRTLARQQKDWARADAIREELAQRKVILLDTPQGTTWKLQSE